MIFFKLVFYFQVSSKGFYKYTKTKVLYMHISEWVPGYFI